MKKKEKREWNYTLLGIGLLSLVFLVNLAFAAIAFGLLFFTAAPIGAILWLPINVAFILEGIYFLIVHAED